MMISFLYTPYTHTLSLKYTRCSCFRTRVPPLSVACHPIGFHPNGQRQFYRDEDIPNPPPVKGWMVPVALINFDNIVEQNWDLTMAKVRWRHPPPGIRPRRSFLGLSIYRQSLT